MSSIWNFLVGKPEQMQQIEALNPQQEQLRNMLLGGLKGPVGSGFGYLQDILGNDSESLQRFQAPYLRQFNEQILPMISERFGLGSGSAGSSSFNQAVSRAGSSLQELLASQREGLRGQALAQLQGLLGSGLSPTRAPVVRPETFGLLGGLGQGISSGLGIGTGMGLSRLLF